MCAPITHLLFAKKIKDKYFPNTNSLAYFSGTLFPDVRHFAGIDKELTHDLEKKLSDLSNLSDWYKGFWVHSILDQVHQLYMRSVDEKSLNPKPRYIAYNLLEDQVYFLKTENLIDYDAYLSTDFKEELDFGVSPDVIREYKRNVRDYIDHKPNYEEQIHFLKQTVPEVRDTPGFVESLREHFDEINNPNVTRNLDKFEVDFLNEFRSQGCE